MKVLIQDLLLTFLKLEPWSPPVIILVWKSVLIAYTRARGTYSGPILAPFDPCILETLDHPSIF